MVTAFEKKMFKLVHYILIYPVDRVMITQIKILIGPK